MLLFFRMLKCTFPTSVFAQRLSFVSRKPGSRNVSVIESLDSQGFIHSANIPGALPFVQDTVLSARPEPPSTGGSPCSEGASGLAREQPN